MVGSTESCHGWEDYPLPARPCTWTGETPVPPECICQDIDHRQPTAVFGLGGIRRPATNKWTSETPVPRAGRIPEVFQLDGSQPIRYRGPDR
jgi:hypothetical protein